jgi:putative flippase GtrA
MRSAPHLRLLKFSMTGALGVGVQLCILAFLAAVSINYLLATAVAVECAVLHNFVWHWHFTFAQQRTSGARQFRFALLRFHVSNGLISILGNLLLMRLLVGGVGLALLPANIASIAACFVANFLASDRWVFRSS